MKYVIRAQKNNESVLFADKDKQEPLIFFNIAHANRIASAEYLSGNIDSYEIFIADKSKKVVFTSDQQDMLVPC
jgi:hypothetical protein